MRTQKKWVEQDYRPFRAEAPQVPVRFYLKAEGMELAQYGEKNLPKIVLFAQGEATPFEWRVQPEWESEPWWISNDGLSRTVVQRHKLEGQSMQQIANDLGIAAGTIRVRAHRAYRRLAAALAPLVVEPA